MAKANYYIELYNNGKPLEPLVFSDSLNWYGVSETEILRVAQGIRIGMQCKYKRPSVRIYQNKGRYNLLVHTIN